MKPSHSLPLALTLTLSPLMAALAAPPTEHPPAVPLAYSLEAFAARFAPAGPARTASPPSTGRISSRPTSPTWIPRSGSSGYIITAWYAPTRSASWSGMKSSTMSWAASR